MTPEQQARQNIDTLLQQAGWHVCDMAHANIHASCGVALREFPLNPGYGFADYLLYIDGKAAGVIEATGVETHFTQGLDPEPRARAVFAFHRPETLAAFLKDLPGKGWESSAAVHTGTEAPLTANDGRQHASLGKLLPLKYGKSLPAQLRDPNGTHPVYGSSGMVGTHSAALTNGPTLIVGRKGNVGAVHYSAVPCWPIDTAYFVEAPEGRNLRY